MIRRDFRANWATASVRLAVALVVLLAANLAQADLRPPGGGVEPRPSKQPVPPAGNAGVPLIVQKDASQKVSRLIIPRRFLNEGFGAGVIPQGNPGINIVSTIVAGSFLSLALVCGLLLAVRRKHAAAAAMLLLAGLAGGYEASTLMANAPAPQNRKAQHRIIIQVSERGDAVVLVQGRDFPDR